MTSHSTHTNTTYNHGNIFAKILKGESPCHTVYKDDKTLAFLDINPSAIGHTLVIPNYPAVELSDLPIDYAAAVFATAQKVIKAQRSVLGVHGITQMQFNGDTAGQSVFHYHIHLVPAHYRVCLENTLPTPSNDDLSALAKQLSNAIAQG